MTKRNTSDTVAVSLDVEDRAVCRGPAWVPRAAGTRTVALAEAHRLSREWSRTVL